MQIFLIACMRKVRFAAIKAMKFRHKTSRYHNEGRHHLFCCFMAFIAAKRERFRNQFFKPQKRKIMEKQLLQEVLNNVAEVELGLPHENKGLTTAANRLFR